MIKLVVVNTYKKEVYIKTLSIGDALNYVRHLYFIPPQSRKVCVVHIVVDDRYYDSMVGDIETYISAMLPDRDTMLKYAKYPVYKE